MNRQPEWWQHYQRYLRSPTWKSKKADVLRRDGYMCQACLTNQATEVHHKTYRHVGNEPLFDLVAVCHPCHERITQMDRAYKDGERMFNKAEYLYTDQTSYDELVELLDALPETNPAYDLIKEQVEAYNDDIPY